MGLLKLLFGKRAKRDDDDDPADNPYSDDDDFSFRDREAARLGTRNTARRTGTPSRRCGASRTTDRACALPA